jgi:uncharacterized membrane protein
MHKSEKGRVNSVDALRGAAVVAMVLYHTFYDLRFFLDIDAELIDSPLWLLGHIGIAGVFFFTSGVSARLSFENSVPIQRTIFRISQVGAGAAIVTASTFVLFPDKWVYCGILHALTVCSVLGLWLRRFPMVCAALSLSSAAAYSFLGTAWPPVVEKSGTMDYVPIFPWVGVYLLGIWAWSSLKIQILLNICVRPLESEWLEALGRHALLAYLIHQPILLGVLWIVFRGARFFAQ